MEITKMYFAADKSDLAFHGLRSCLEIICTLLKCQFTWAYRFYRNVVNCSIVV